MIKTDDYVLFEKNEKFLRLFRDEFSDEKWNSICQVLNIENDGDLKSIELGIYRTVPQIC